MPSTWAEETIFTNKAQKIHVCLNCADQMELIAWFRECSSISARKQIDKIVEFFSYLRTHSLRRPDLILPLIHVLRDIKDETVEYWEAIELAAFAAADVSNYAVFDWCCNKVKQRFGDNWRLHRLLGLFHEIRLDYKAAAAVYEAGLAKFPNSPELYKRQVAILKSLNAYEQAATVLCNYLETFMCDEESWSELVYIYMYLRKYEEAAFAVSELIVLAPSNWFYFLLLAEIYYAMGNYQCLLTARKYCCYVCKLQQNCPRVYYDLLLICRSLEKYPRSSKDVNNERLLQYAAKHLKQLYKYSYYLYAVEDLVRK